jgi:hypothetical protein
MAENSDGAVVTEIMLIEAARAGDLESLTIWARQGVRVMSALPLNVAAQVGCLSVLRFLVRGLGANVNQGDRHGRTPLIIAAQWDHPAMVQCLSADLGADVNQAIPRNGHTPFIVAACRDNLAVVRCLVQFGAEVGAKDTDGDTGLLASARDGCYGTMQYLLEEAGAIIEDVNNFGNTVWDLLRWHLEDTASSDDDDDEKEANLVALTGLLHVMVLHDAPPPELVALLSPEPARVAQEGARLRARLPAYLAHRRAYLDLRCPRISLLPGVLRALICTFEGPGTTEELWATGLGTAL